MLSQARLSPCLNLSASSRREEWKIPGGLWKGLSLGLGYKGCLLQKASLYMAIWGGLLPTDLTVLLAFLHSFNKHGLGAEIPCC